MLSNTAIRDYLTTLQPTWGATHWAAATGFGLRGASVTQPNTMAPLFQQHQPHLLQVASS